jgi:hypothetical protein
MRIMPDIVVLRAFRAVAELAADALDLGLSLA